MDDVFAEYVRLRTGAAPAPILNVIAPAELDGRWIPPREWVVEDWLPIGTVTANYGDGGTGKTLLAQQLMTSASADVAWCGYQVLQCRSFGLFCEDDEAELHRRQSAINTALGVEYSALGNMRWISGVGEDNALVRFDADGMLPTPLLTAITKAAKDFKARLLVLDTAADLFPGNENDRHQVRQFIGALTKVAIEIDGAVLLNAHPSRTGLTTGNLDGGSTAWNNSVRSRWSLARPAAEDGSEDADARVLTRRKANYARIGDTVPLRWVNGVLVPLSAAGGAPGAPYQAAVEVVFLDLLDRLAGQGVFVSHSKNAPNFAPKVFGKRGDRLGYTAKDFEAAMSRLFEGRQIKSETYGRRSDERKRIARAGGADAP